MRRAAELLSAVLLIAAAAQQTAADAKADPLAVAAEAAQRQLRQTFANLQFEEVGPAPVKGPLYQAIAGGGVLYFASESGHLVFAAVYDRNAST